MTDDDSEPLPMFDVDDGDTTDSDSGGDDKGSRDLGIGVPDWIDPAAAATRLLIKWVVLIGVPVFACLVLVYGMLEFLGPLTTIVCLFAFVMGLTFIPFTVFLGAPSFPGFLKTLFGSLHFILGQTAYERGVLVEFEDRYEMCPAERDRVYIDGDWHEVEGGMNEWTVLGWQPFAMLRYKNGKTWRRERADARAATGGMADGGTDQTKRGSFGEHRPDPSISGTDGTWLLDLKRVYTRAVSKMGDTALLEKAEEIAARKEAKESRTSGMEPLIGSAIGLVLGIATGYVMLVGF